MGAYKKIHIDIINMLLDSDIQSISINGDSELNHKTVTIVIRDTDIDNDEDDEFIDHDDIPRTLS